MSNELNTNKSELGKRKRKIKKSILETNKLFVKNIRETSISVKFSNTPNTSLIQQLIISDKPSLCEVRLQIK